MGTIKALKCCQNLYQVVVCPYPEAFFQMMTLGWPWPFLWQGKICSWCFCVDDSLKSIECSCISKFVLIQHILSTQVSDTGPMVLWFVVSFSNSILLHKFWRMSVIWICQKGQQHYFLEKWLKVDRNLIHRTRTRICGLDFFTTSVYEIMHNWTDWLNW